MFYDFARIAFFFTCMIYQTLFYLGWRHSRFDFLREHLDTSKYTAQWSRLTGVWTVLCSRSVPGCFGLHFG